MHLISHRGNINGIDKDTENKPEKIIKCINEYGYEVEIDVWFKEGKFFLGHDFPQYEFDIKIFLDFRHDLWIHCKNIDALWKLPWQFHRFFHDQDDCTITTQGFFWTFPSKKLTPNSICVLPEKANYIEKELFSCSGICSDFIENYRK